MNPDFKYVLRHYHWNADHPQLFASYEEQATSKPTVIDGKKASTIFLKTDSARLRALKFGWVDETEGYKKSITKQNPSPVKMKVKKTSGKK